MLFASCVGFAFILTLVLLAFAGFGFASAMSKTRVFCVFLRKRFAEEFFAAFDACILCRYALGPRIHA